MRASLCCPIHTSYDKAGNLVYDNFSPSVSQRGTMTYDAENHLVTAVNGTQRYRYDANGRRVKRLVGQAGEVWQVYSPEGELLAEYPKQGAETVPTKEYGYQGGQLLVVFDSTEVAADDKLKWLVADHLGSTRMIVNKSGSLVGIKRRDYSPFGEELAASVGHRAAGGSGYQVTDKPRQKFGSKERDTETGLDYFLARYYSSVQGRFTSPDPVGHVGVEESDPQTWNLYAYTRNNPLKFSDPDGLKVRICDTNGNCVEVSDSDANRYLYNKKYQQQSGYRTDGKGNIFDTQGNKIGTYQNISCDACGGTGADRLFYNELPRRMQAVKNGIYIVGALNLAAPTAIMGAEIASGAAFEGVQNYFITVRGARPFSHLTLDQLKALISGKNRLLAKWFESGSTEIPPGLNTKDLKVYLEVALRDIARGQGGVDVPGVGQLQYARLLQILKALGEIK
jgi:RHS repeat-associated protein